MGIRAVRRSREGSSVDGGAARRVGDHHVVAEQLGDGLDVRGFAAARAGAAEFEQRLRELGILHVGRFRKDVILVADLRVEVVEALLFFQLLLSVDHDKGLPRSRADVDAVAAARAVQHGDRKGEGIFLQRCPAGRALQALRRLFEIFLFENERTDGGVRADEGTGGTLDALARIPFRNQDSDAPLLKGGCAGRHGAVGVGQEGTDRKAVSVLRVDDVGDGFHEFGGQAVFVRGFELGCDLRPLGGHSHFGIFSSALDGGVVHIHHLFALVSVTFHDRVLHVFHGVVVGDDAGDLEEGGLQDRVGPAAEPDFLGDLGGVDDIQLDFLLADNGFHVVGDPLEGIFLVPETVQ